MVAPFQSWLLKKESGQQHSNISITSFPLSNSVLRTSTVKPCRRLILPFGSTELVLIHMLFCLVSFIARVLALYHVSRAFDPSFYIVMFHYSIFLCYSVHAVL